jgi:hypothetical protein
VVCKDRISDPTGGSLDNLHEPCFVNLSQHGVDGEHSGRNNTGDEHFS